MNADHLDEADVERWRTMIVATGAVEWIEELITERVAHRDGSRLPAACRRAVQAALASMVTACTARAA